MFGLDASYLPLATQRARRLARLAESGRKGAEQLELKSISAEEAKKRTAELRKMRDLLFYHDIKAKCAAPQPQPQPSPQPPLLRGDQGRDWASEPGLCPASVPLTCQDRALCCARLGRRPQPARVHTWKGTRPRSPPSPHPPTRWQARLQNQVARVPQGSQEAERGRGARRTGCAGQRGGREAAAQAGDGACDGAHDAEAQEHVSLGEARAEAPVEEHGGTQHAPSHPLRSHTAVPSPLRPATSEIRLTPPWSGLMPS